MGIYKALRYFRITSFLNKLINNNLSFNDYIDTLNSVYNIKKTAINTC